MSTNVKLLIAVLVVAGAAAAFWYVRMADVPNSAPETGINTSTTTPTRNSSTTPTATAADVAAAPNNQAAVDAAVNAIIQNASTDESIATQEDSDAAYVSEDITTLNSMKEAANGSEF